MYTILMTGTRFIDTGSLSADLTRMELSKYFCTKYDVLRNAVCVDSLRTNYKSQYFGK